MRLVEVRKESHRRKDIRLLQFVELETPPFAQFFNQDVIVYNVVSNGGGDV
jgi:hypothetical protein